MSRYNRRNRLSKTFKDYLVPMIGAVLIIVLLFSFFGGKKDTSNKVTEENRTGVHVTLNGEGGESYVIYTGGKKEEIQGSTELYKGEKLVVKEGTASVEIPEIGNIEVNKIGELKYDEDGGFSLYSSDIWVNLKSSQKINMRYGSIFAKENAVFSITQNEVGSTIYMLKGVADVTNLASRSVVLGKGQKITISRSDAAKDDIDLSIERTDIDDYFKSSEWYIRNNGDFYINSTESTGTGTTEDGDTSTLSVGKGLLSIDSPSDEISVDTNKITIKGSFSSEEINSIEVDGKKASMDFESNTFELKDFTLTEKENNLIFKIYDTDSDILGKMIRTVYYNGGNTAPVAGRFQVENFSLDASKFTFVAPKTNPYTTSTSLVTIQGYVPPGIVSKISVNGFTLQKFPAYGSYWKYHANEDFGNLKEGLNIYKVTYYGKEGEVLHSNAFTIIKKTPVVETPAVKEKTISEEAKIEA